jgi:UDP-glucuronate 4-epimerase
VAKVFVTGVAGCIGAWVARHLLEEGHEVVGVDASEEVHRLRLVGVAGAFPLYRLDVRDFDGLRAVVARERPDGLIHLAALQVPSCRADPRLCSEVNVGGMLNILEVARVFELPLSYASSAAVYGPDLGRPLSEWEGVKPQTLYGVFKRTNEEMARIYYQDWGIPSAGFRPYVVYGPGRDAGITSDITVALLHAARGEPFRIRFGGRVALQHVSDVARAFIAATLRPPNGAAVYNLRGHCERVADVVELIGAVTGASGLVTYDEQPLPIAADLDEGAFQRDYGPLRHMPLEEGFRKTLEVWREGGYL